MVEEDQTFFINNQIERQDPVGTNVILTVMKLQISQQMKVESYYIKGMSNSHRVDGRTTKKNMEAAIRAVSRRRACLQW